MIMKTLYRIVNNIFEQNGEIESRFRANKMTYYLVTDPMDCCYYLHYLLRSLLINVWSWEVHYSAKASTSLILIKPLNLKGF